MTPSNFELLEHSAETLIRLYQTLLQDAKLLRQREAALKLECERLREANALAKQKVQQLVQQFKALATENI